MISSDNNTILYRKFVPLSNYVFEIFLNQNDQLVRAQLNLPYFFHLLKINETLIAVKELNIMLRLMMLIANIKIHFYTLKIIIALLLHIN